jgi:hypothetical protein
VLVQEKEVKVGDGLHDVVARLAAKVKTGVETLVVIKLPVALLAIT